MKKKSRDFTSALRPLAAVFCLAVMAASVCSCSTGKRGDEGEIGGATSNYPLGDTGLNQRFEDQNKMVRELGL